MNSACLRRAVVLAIVAGAATVCLAGAKEKVQYELKVKKGQKYYLKNVTEQQIFQAVMGQPQSMEQTIGIGVDLDVNDVDGGGNMLVYHRYSWIQFRQKGPAGEIVYDSAKKDVRVPVGAEGFAALVGEGYLMKLTPMGRVVEVKGAERMAANVRRKLPPGPTGDQMMKPLARYFTEKAIKEGTEASMGIYPDKPVGVGDSWKTKVAMSQGFAVIVESEWAVRGRKEGVATVGIVSTIKPNPKAEPLDMGVMKMSYQLSGKQGGTMQLEESTGMIVSSELNQEISGEVKMIITSGDPGRTAGQEMVIPMTMKSKVTNETTLRRN